DRVWNGGSPMDEGEKPILDQCVQGAQDADGISGAVGVQGQSGDPGYVQLGNIIQQWGTLTADAVGVAVTFPVPYASVPFVVATGEVSTVYAKPTPTGVTITSPAIRTPNRELAGAGLLTAPRRRSRIACACAGRRHASLKGQPRAPCLTRA